MSVSKHQSNLKQATEQLEKVRKRARRRGRRGNQAARTTEGAANGCGRTEFSGADATIMMGLFKKRAPQVEEVSQKVDISSLKALFEGKTLSLADFQLFSTVGTGAFGRVRMVKYMKDPEGTPLALKMVKKSEVVRLNQVEHVRNEKNILTTVSHPFIVNLLATFQDEHRLYFLFEYVNGGELFTHLRKMGKLSVEETRFYAAEIVLAFEYLHDRQIIYRDTKPENMLIDCQGHLKISDFGFAKVVTDRTWTNCGTPEFIAPEIVQAKGHNKGVDYWALGCLMFEMLCGNPPFYGDTAFEIYAKIIEGNLDFPRFFDSKAKDLVKGLLTYDRAKRLGCLKNGAEDIKKHKFFSKYVDWTQAQNRQLSPVFLPPVKAADDTSMFDSYPESDSFASASHLSKPADYQHLFADF